MKKQIKNGFVIIETLVVIVFVLGMITFLFNNVLPLVGEYERVNKYDHIGSKYDVHLIRKMLLRDDNCKLENILSFGTGTYNRFAGKDICLYLNNKNYCDKLLSKDFLDVKEIIITDYVLGRKNELDPKKLKDLLKENDLFSRELNDYINYIPNFNNTYIPAQYFFKKRLIVVFNDGTISNIELLKTLSGTCTGGMSCM